MMCGRDCCRCKVESGNSSSHNCFLRCALGGTVSVTNDWNLTNDIVRTLERLFEPTAATSRLHMTVMPMMSVMQVMAVVTVVTVMLVVSVVPVMAMVFVVHVPPVVSVVPVMAMMIVVHVPADLAASLRIDNCGTLDV